MDDDLQAYLDKHESEGDKAMEGPDKNFENAKQHYAKYLKKANGKLEVDNEDLMWVKKNYSEALMNLTLVEEADEIHKELLAQFPKNILVQFPDDRKESMIGLVKDILYLRSFRAMTLHAHNKLPEVAQAEQVLKQALRDSKRILGKKDGPEKSETTRELDRNLEVVKNTLKRLQYEDLLSQKQHGGPTSPGNEPPSFPFRQTREVRPSTSDAEESSASAANTSSRDISFKATKQPVSVEFDIVSQPSSSKEEQRGRLPKISDAHLLTGTREVYDKTDAFFSEYLEKTQSFVHTRAAGKPRVKLAVLDTGLNTTHPEVLKMLEEAKKNPGLGRVVKYKSWVPDLDDQGDLDGHGTHCAMVAHKVAPNADIYIARIFKDSHSVDGEHVAKAIEWAIEKWKVDIISMSFALAQTDRIRRDAVYTAIAKYPDKPLMFAAASNGGKLDWRRFPASHPDVFCIHSATSDGNPSSFNPTADANDNYSVLGEFVEAPHKGTATERLSGTSVATPIAAGIAALVLDFARQKKSEDQRKVVREPRKLRTKEGMDNVFAKMVDPRMKGRSNAEYFNLQPWHLLGLRENEAEDFDDTCDRVSIYINDAIANVYCPPP